MWSKGWVNNNNSNNHIISQLFFGLVVGEQGLINVVSLLPCGVRAAAAGNDEGDSAAFSRERKEMRENFDKETKAMKRQIELLQVCLPGRTSLAAPNVGMCWCRGRQETTK